MNHEHQHILTVIDFYRTQHSTTFVKVTGYDAILEKNFEGEVKFVNSMPFGDLINPQRSSLSAQCIQFIRARLLKKHSSGDFI